MEEKTKRKKLEATIEIAEGVNFEVVGNLIKIKGEKGEIERKIPSRLLNIQQENNQIKITSKKNTRKEKRLINSLKAHLTNMIKGVKEPFIYKLKVCSSHFPMNVKFENNELNITNFLGEKVPRKTKISGNVKVKVEGDIIIIESPDMEVAGTAATRIEQSTRISNKDKRVFEDGVYIIEKPNQK